MKSRNGIYYNLEESEYETNIDNFTFVFSSLFYQKMFLNNLENYLEYENNRLNKILLCDYLNKINLKELILINHYRRIEKRGFLIYYKNKKLTDYKFIINLETR